MGKMVGVWGVVGRPRRLARWANVGRTTSLGRRGSERGRRGLSECGRGAACVWGRSGCVGVVCGCVFGVCHDAAGRCVRVHAVIGCCTGAGLTWMTISRRAYVGPLVCLCVALAVLPALQWHTHPAPDTPTAHPAPQCMGPHDRSRVRHDTSQCRASGPPDSLGRPPPAATTRGALTTDPQPSCPTHLRLQPAWRAPHCNRDVLG